MSSDRKVIPSGKSINGYQIVYIIGVGGFGGIYKVKEKKTNQVFAMKTENINTKKKTLPNETECLKQLKEDFFPKIRESGESSKYKINYVIMNLLGPSIGGIFNYHHKKLEREVVYNVCYNMLRIIKSYHSYGYVHCDIKPSNFLIQQDKKAPLVLIDFGLCQKHIDPQTNKPVPYRTGLVFSGTKKYASFYAHEGCLQGRRDDIMSWFYSLIDLFCGSLPWENLDNIDEVIDAKKNLKLSEIGEFPPEFEEILSYIKTLNYDDKPKYAHIGQLLQQAMEKEGFYLTEFDWFSFFSEHSNLINVQRTMSLNMIKALNQKNHKKSQEMSNKSFNKANSAPVKKQKSNESTEKSKSHHHHHHKNHHNKDSLPPPIPENNESQVTDHEQQSKEHKNGKECEIQ